MDNGALPVPQGLMTLLGGLLPARQVTGETAENRAFQDLLSQLLAGGELTLEDLSNADVPQVMLPLLVAADGNTLPLQDGSGSPGGAVETDLEAILALLGVKSFPPSNTPGGPQGQVVGGVGQGPLQPPVVPGQVEVVPAAGGADKSVTTSLQSTQTPPVPPVGAIPVAALEAPAVPDPGHGQNQGAARASEQALPAPLRPADGPAPGAAIQTPVSRPEWGHELGQRVLWMTAGQGSQHAELKLNPPQLGPLEVRVVVRNDEVSVFFNANHAVTREALEQALPRLREMLGANGIPLAEANVSGGRDEGGERAAFGHDGDGSRGRDASGPLPQGGDHEPDGLPRPLAASARGLVDTYV